MAADRRVFWRSDTCCVWVHRNRLGLVFYVHDKSYQGTPEWPYEYWITVPSSQFPALRVAFDAGPSVDVVDLVCARAEDIMSRGESTWLVERGMSWLDERGLEYEFTPGTGRVL